MFFRLSHQSYLVGGKNRIIYNLDKQKAYLLDKESSEIVKHCENNYPVEEVPEYEQNCFKVMKLLNYLHELNLGKFYDHKIHIDKFLYNVPLNLRGFALPNPIYGKVFLEINNECNLNCDFCGKEGIMTWLGCRSCIRKKLSCEKTADIDAQSFLKELKSIDARQLIIRGGNPFTKIDYLKSLVSYAKEITPDMRITIVSNGCGTDLENVLMLYGINFNILFNINLFGSSEEDYLRIFGSQEVLYEQENMINVLKQNKIPFQITVLVSDKTVSANSDIIDKIRDKWGIVPIMAQAVDSNVKGSKLNHIKDNNKPVSSLRHYQEFFLRQQYNTCLVGTFSIACDGKVHPCPMLHDPLGDLNSEKLGDVLGNQRLYTYWEMTKDKVSGCKNCGMRYICTDCSVFEVEENKRKNIHNIYCNINTENEDLSAIDFGSGNIVEKISL